MLTAKMASEVETHRWVINASDLGWKPGHAARTILTDMGNGRPFVFQGINEAKTKLTYRQEFGCLTLIVFND